MAIKIFIIALMLNFSSCKTKHSNMEICFENIQNRIGSDSVLKKIKLSSVDSYKDFALLIHRVVTEESQSNQISKTALSEFLIENKGNSITVNNLIFFQQFQAFLKHEKFDKVKAKEIALNFEEKWR